MAAAVLAIYRDAIITGATELRTDLTADPFGTDNLHVARSIDESKLLNEPSMPCIIISAAGMVTGGRVVHHLSALTPDPRNLIVLAGFQVPGTRGRELLDGATAVKAHGRYIQVRAPVLGLDEFSRHANADQLIDWLRTAPRRPDTCFAVHGESAAAAALTRRIHHELDWCAAVAHHAERVWA
jgi:metallo-beta-lactamase family protein